MSYQCAIDAVTSRCFPSYALRRRAKAVGALAQLEYLLIAAALAEGWVVSVPDHEGPDGMWGTPHEPGYRVLDGLRATLNFERFGLRRRTARSACGATPAADWPARGPPRCTPTYAPELNIVGAVLGSPVGNLGNTFRRLNGTHYCRPARAGGRRAGQDLPRPEPGDRGARHRRRPRAAGSGWSG